MSLISGLGNFLGHLFQPQPQRPQPPQAQAPARPQPQPVYELGHFLATHLGNAVRNPIGEVAHDANAVKARIAQVPNVHLQGIEQLTGKPVTIGSIGQGIKNYEKKNPYLTTKTVIYDPKLGHNVINPEAIKLNTDIASGTIGGADKAAGNVGKEVIKSLAKLKVAPGVPHTMVDAAKLVAHEGTDPAQVTAYKNAIQDGAAIQPIKVLTDSKGVQGVEDGKHRLEAMRQLGITHVPVETTAKLKTRGLTKGVQSSPNFSPELQQSVHGEYTAATNKEALANHENFMQQPLAARHQQAIHALADSKSALTKQQVVDYGKTMQHLDEAGRTDEASAIHDLLSAKLTNAGQSSQAASLLYNRTPEGLKNIAFRDLRNAKVNLTPELQQEIEGHIKAIKGMQDGPAKDFAVAVLQKAVAKHLPQSKVDNAVSLWKAGLLSGVKTQGGNLLSNGTFAGLKKLADPISTAADKVMSIRTKQRTKTLTFKGDLSGAGEGLKNAKTTMKTGIDMRNVGDKYEQHAEINLGNKYVQKLLGDPANMVFRGMTAADQPFYYSALKNSLYDQAKADGINAGVHGKALTEHMTKLVQNPTEKMVETAGHEAQKSVLGFDTVASKAISSVHRAIDNSGASPLAKSTANAALNVLAPFTKVPTAFLSRTIDFTPLGPVKTAMEQISRKEFDQRALSQAIGEGATGTGLIAIGIQLAHNKMLSGDFPTNDAKEQARWKAEGITPNSVKLGNQWVSLNYLGPVGMLFNAGAKMKEAGDGGVGAAGQAGQAIAGLGQGLLGQSFLQGFSGFSNAIQDPARNGASFVNSQASSIVPNIVNDIGNATDDFQRQASGVGDSIKARIPGLRQELTPKFDAFGNDLKQASGSGLQTALNPLKPSNSVDNPMLSELNRLHGQNQDVFPVPSKILGSGKTKVKLSVPQQAQRQKLVGTTLVPLWNGIMQTPEYKAMDDAHKKDALQSALTDANTAADRQLLAKLAPDQLAKPATARVVALINGTAVPGDYVKPKTTAKVKAVKSVRLTTAKTGTKRASSGTKAVTLRTQAVRARLASKPKQGAPKNVKFKTFSFKAPKTVKAKYAKVATARVGSSKRKNITA